MHQGRMRMSPPTMPGSAMIEIQDGIERGSFVMTSSEMTDVYRPTSTAAYRRGRSDSMSPTLRLLIVAREGGSQRTL